MKRKFVFIIGSGLILTCLIIVASVLLFRGNRGPSLEDRVYVDVTTCFTKNGILYSCDGLLRYTDALSRRSVVLCDKPDCQHKTQRVNILEQTCNAVVGIDTFALAIYKGRLYFDIWDGRIVHIFEADTNGANRREITKLDNIQFITGASYCNDYLLICYRNSYDYQANSIAGVELEKPVAGIVAINLKSRTVTYLPQKEDYGAATGQAYYYNNRIYYRYSYNDVKIDYTDMNFFIHNPAFINEHTYRAIYCYELDSKKEACIYTGQELSIEDYCDDYAYIVDSGKLYQLNLTDLKKRLLAEDDFFRCFVDADNKDQLIYMANSADGSNTIFKTCNIKTGEIKEIGQSDIYSILCVCGDFIYVFYNDDNGECCYGYINKQDFYNCNISIDKVVPLVYPNLVGK